MTYHRTTGKGGSVDRSRNPKQPNFNKSTKSGSTSKPRRGKNKPARSSPRQ